MGTWSCHVCDKKCRTHSEVGGILPGRAWRSWRWWRGDQRIISDREKKNHANPANQYPWCSLMGVKLHEIPLRSEKCLVSIKSRFWEATSAIAQIWGSSSWKVVGEYLGGTSQGGKVGIRSVRPRCIANLRPLALAHIMPPQGVSPGCDSFIDVSTHQSTALS